MLDRCVLSCCLALLAWTSFAIHWHVSTFCIYERWGAIERPANATSSCSNRGAWGQCWGQFSQLYIDWAQAELTLFQTFVLIYLDFVFIAVQTAAPFLFPCTIEYSLICAVILFEMWKHISTDKKHSVQELKSHKDSHQLSINCAGSNRGMFGGILVGRHRVNDTKATVPQ